VLGIYVFIMAIFVGFEVISRVPSVLHTPLMSGTNAIHGIVVLGGLLVLGEAVEANDTLSKVILVIAIVFGTINVVGGFLVTDRMLGMFKRTDEQRATANQKQTHTRLIIAASCPSRTAPPGAAPCLSRPRAPAGPPQTSKTTAAARRPRLRPGSPAGAAWRGQLARSGPSGRGPHAPRRA